MTTAWTLALVAALLSASAALLHRRARRRREARRVARRPSCLRHPVVLAHGLLGFDVLERDGERREYFNGIPALLADRGCTVHRPRVAPVASIATRAAALAAFVRALPHRRVNVIAHSMGGLDARFAIARLGLASRVASLTTIGTPHHGTPLADVAIGLGVGYALDRLGLERDALDGLTTAGAAAFNEAVPDDPAVAYGSVVGALQRKRRAHPLLLASWAVLRSAAGANDGVVPASSQRWGDVLAEIDADHFAQVGRSRAFDASAFYEGLASELRGRGF